MIYRFGRGVERETMRKTKSSIEGSLKEIWCCWLPQESVKHTLDFVHAVSRTNDIMGVAEK